MRSPKSIEPLIRQALEEDLANQSDITTALTVPENEKIKAVMRARQAGILAGIKVAAMVFDLYDSSLSVEIQKQSGEQIQPGDEIMSIEGPARSILTAERTALNFMTHLSGIATLTRQYIDAIDGTGAKILDTRKTIPGLRALQKYAVEAGGGHNHRMGLYDAILIKDNHIAAAGSISTALDSVEDQDLKIEIEVDRLEQLEEVLDHGGADIVMLDNMDLETLQKATAMAKGKITTEASGGITLENVRSIAETGVNYISIGALTHSAPALDIGLDIDD